MRESCGVWWWTFWEVFLWNAFLYCTSVGLCGGCLCVGEFELSVDGVWACGDGFAREDVAFGPEV